MEIYLNKDLKMKNLFYENEYYIKKLKIPILINN